MSRGDSSDSRIRPALLGRRRECETLSGLVAAAKAGRSQVLVLRGEAGIGKTALLEFLLERAAGCRVGRAAGVESEMELAFAGLHQLCGPYLDRLDQLPAPQREALGTAFGLRPGSAPDRFLVGLAVLTLLSEVAEERPLICVVDDAQWLDQASAQTLEFVARRLRAEPVAHGLRRPRGRRGAALAGLPELVVRGLSSRDAAALLDSAVTGALDPAVRDRILAESHGNPLALLELPRGLSAAELAFGGVSAAGATPLVQPPRAGLPAPAGSPCPRAVPAAAAGRRPPNRSVTSRCCGAPPSGSASRPDAASAAEAAGLIELRDRVRFRHPLVRSAVYRSATPAERREVAPGARRRHRPGPRSRPPRLAPRPRRRGPGRGGRRGARAVGRAAHSPHGGLAAAAAFLEQAAALTPDPARRARRSLDAAQVKVPRRRVRATPRPSWRRPRRCRSTSVDAGPDRPAAGGDLLRRDRGNEALPLLLAAAAGSNRRPEASRATPTSTRSPRRCSPAAWPRARVHAGGRGRAAAAAAEPRRARSTSLLEGSPCCSPTGTRPPHRCSRRAVAGFRQRGTDAWTRPCASAWLAAADSGLPVGRRRLGRPHPSTSGDRPRGQARSARFPWPSHTRVVVQLFTGDLAAAASLVEETRSVTEATGSTAGALRRGRAWPPCGVTKSEAEPLIQRCLEDVVARGEGVGVNMAQWARAVLCNGLGRYEDALPRLRRRPPTRANSGRPSGRSPSWSRPGCAAGPRAAAAALEQLTAMTRASGTDWALGIEASRRALLRDGPPQKRCYREAIDRLARTRSASSSPAHSCSTANGCAGKVAGPTPARSCGPRTRR